jgi:hypothetical protein
MPHTPEHEIPVVILDGNDGVVHVRTPHGYEEGDIVTTGEEKLGRFGVTVEDVDPTDDYQSPRDLRNFVTPPGELTKDYVMRPDNSKPPEKK